MKLMNTSDIKNGLIIGGLIVIAALSRLIDHPMNFTPIGAIILFGAAVIPNKILKFTFPFSVILFSDFLIEIISGFGFHSGTLIVYFGYAVIFLLGYFYLKNFSLFKIVIASLLGSSLFFLLTNFSFFYPSALVSNPALGIYSRDLSGILTSYSAGVPFFKNMLVGDLIFNGLLFGAFYLFKAIKVLKITNTNY